MRDEQLRTLKGHWESLQVMLGKLDLTEHDRRNMQRAFYAGAVSMITVMKVRVGELEKEPSEDEGSDLIQSLTKEALQGMIDCVTGV